MKGRLWREYEEREHRGWAIEKTWELAIEGTERVNYGMPVLLVPTEECDFAVCVLG